jgi:hypothetical protein
MDALLGLVTLKPDAARGQPTEERAMTVSPIRMKGFARKSHPQVLSDLLGSRIAPLPGERVPVEEGHRRILAESISLPPSRSLSPFLDERFASDGEVGVVPTGFPRGHRLTPMDLALLVYLDVREVLVHRRPSVAVLVTGNELLPCGAKPEGHRIVDSNSVMLSGLILRDGGLPQPPALMTERLRQELRPHERHGFPLRRPGRMASWFSVSVAIGACAGYPPVLVIASESPDGERRSAAKRLVRK